MDDAPDNMIDLAARLEILAEKTGLDRVEIAHALVAEPRGVAEWLQHTTALRPSTQERILELIAVLERLSHVLHRQAAHDWLFAPNPLIEGDKPADLLRAGHSRRVLGAIDALAESLFA